MKAHFVVSPISCYRHIGDSVVYLVNTDPSITRLFHERGVRVIGQTSKIQRRKSPYPEIDRLIQRAFRYNFVAGPMVLGYKGKVAMSGDFSGISRFDRIEQMEDGYYSGGPQIMHVADTDPESMVFLRFFPDYDDIPEDEATAVLKMWRDGYQAYWRRVQTRTGVYLSRLSLSAILRGGMILTPSKMWIVDFDYIQGESNKIEKISLHDVLVYS